MLCYVMLIRNFQDLNAIEENNLSYDYRKESRHVYAGTQKTAHLPLLGRAAVQDRASLGASDYGWRNRRRE